MIYTSTTTFTVNKILNSRTSYQDVSAYVTHNGATIRYNNKTFTNGTHPQLDPQSLVIGDTYEIRSVIDVDFTLIGASSNELGTIFTSTATTTPGVGSVYDLVNFSPGLISVEGIDTTLPGVYRIKLKAESDADLDQDGVTTEILSRNTIRRVVPTATITLD